MKLILRLISAFCAAMLLGLSVTGVSAAQYPERAIRLIVPFPPGGGASTMARLLSQPLTEALGQQIVIDNRGGGSTIIGAQLAAAATPDGYTLFFSPNQLAINPLAFPDLPYDPVRDFDSVARIGSSALILVSNPKFEARSVQQLIDIAKAKPGALSVASSGNFGPPHLAIELFKHMTGTTMVHVPYRGSGLALPALVGGQVQFMFGTMPSALPQVNANRLRALAVTTAKRSDVIPDLPTVAETVPGYEVTVWYAMVAPAKTPPRIIKHLNTEINRILESTEFKKRMAASGAETTPGTPEEMTSFLLTETIKYKSLLNSIK
jgi:tripartite-type tricarboxylate transporter receptor subunit TctC